MNYTPFGEYFRMLRIKHREILNDAKDFLGVTSAYISSVECGKRPVPEAWAELISEHYHLSEEEKKQLNDAIEQSKTSVKISLADASSAQRNVAIQFQRSFGDIDDETANEIIKIFERNKNSGL